MRTAIMLAALAAGLASSASVALAQKSEIDVSSPPATSEGGWETMSRLATRDQVKIVLVATPNRKRSCTVSSFGPDHITCSRRFGRKPVEFRQQDVAAVLLPGKGTNDGRDRAVGETVAGGIIAGAVFLGRTGSVGAIVGATLIGVVGLCVAGVFGIADDGGPDTTIYLRPGLQLNGIPQLP